MEEKVQRNTQLSFWWKAKSSSCDFAFETFISVVGSAANSVGTTLEFTAFGSGLDAKPSRANALWFFLSTTMVFAAVRTHFPKKNTRVCRNTVTCVTRITSNRVEVHRLNSLFFFSFFLSFFGNYFKK